MPAAKIKPHKAPVKLAAKATPKVVAKPAADSSDTFYIMRTSSNQPLIVSHLSKPKVAEHKIVHKPQPKPKLDDNAFVVQLGVFSNAKNAKLLLATL